MARRLRRSRDPDAPALERRAETRFGLRAAAEGWRYVKLQIAGRRGWPDRMLLMSDRVVVFIEWKRYAQRPRALQRRVHRELMARGFHVIVGYDENVVFDECVALARALGVRPVDV